MSLSCSNWSLSVPFALVMAFCVAPGAQSAGMFLVQEQDHGSRQLQL